MKSPWEIHTGTTDGKRYLELYADGRPMTERDLILVSAALLGELRARTQDRVERRRAR